MYDILDYSTKGWHHSNIAITLGLSSTQVLAALEYIDDHKEEVMAEYQKILERIARGNPPEVQARLDEIHAKYQALWAERRRASNNGSMP